MITSVCLLYHYKDQQIWWIYCNLCCWMQTFRRILWILGPTKGNVQTQKCAVFNDNRIQHLLQKNRSNVRESPWDVTSNAQKQCLQEQKSQSQAHYDTYVITNTFQNVLFWQIDCCNYDKVGAITRIKHNNTLSLL